MAKLEKGQFLSESEAEERLLLQSGFGKKMGSKFILHPLEAAYISDIGFAKIVDKKKEMNCSQIIKSQKAGRGQILFKDQYLIYKHIRLGGRIIRFSSHSPQYWRVYARGVGREQERPQMLLRLADSRWKTSLSSLGRELAVARMLRLELVLAYVEHGMPQWIKLGKHSFG